MKKLYFIPIILVLIFLPLGVYFKLNDEITVTATYSEIEKMIDRTINPPMVSDKNFIIETFVQDLERPTTMAFLGNDIIVLEKSGSVKLIQNGYLLRDPILKLDVYEHWERGLLGITSLDSTVYLYFTQEKDEERIHNYIYKYQWNGTSLNNPELVTILPGQEVMHSQELT